MVDSFRFTFCQLYLTYATLILNYFQSLNNSIYTLLWSTDFPLGGPEEDLQWTVRVVSEEGEVAELAVDTPTLNTRGQVEAELDFQQLDMDSSWVQTCENSSLVPVYNVSVRAALRTPAAVFTGPWSEVFSLQPTCQPAVEYWKIILMVVGASLAFLIVIGGLVHSIRYAKKQKDYFKDLGMVSIRQHSVRKICKNNFALVRSSRANISPSRGRTPTRMTFLATIFRKWMESL